MTHLIQLIEPVDDRSFYDRVLMGSRPKLVLFTRPGCAPCGLLAGHLPELAADLRGVVDVVRCPAERSPVATYLYRVRRAPTLMLFRGGRAVATQDRLSRLPAVRRWVLEALHAACDVGGDSSSSPTDSGEPSSPVAGALLQGSR